MPALLEARDDLAKGVARLQEKARFVEVEAQAVGGYTVRLDSHGVYPRPSSRISGTIFRVWGGDRWIEVAGTGTDRATIQHLVEETERRIPAGAARADPPGVSATTVGSRETRPKHPISELSVEERVAVAKEMFGWGKAVPGIMDVSVSLTEHIDHRLYLNSAGANCYQQVLRAGAGVAPIAIENGKAEYDFVGYGGVGGREFLDSVTEARVTEAATCAREMLSAKAPPTGVTAVLLDPSTSGTLAHESFGHGTEADQFVRERSYLKPLVGQMVAPEFITLVDDGSAEGGNGQIYFDDEGHPSQRTPLIDHGRFVGALNDRETGAALGQPATGNTRRSDYTSRPFVRMTNTFLEAGDWGFDELLEEAKEGVLLERCTSGIEDPLGGQMQIKVKRGRLIEHGKLTGRVASMALSGKVLDVLKQIKGISGPADFELTPGFCGKGHSDYLPVSSGGTYLLSTAIVGPA